MSYVFRLRQLAVPCNFGANLELLRAVDFGCGTGKLEELTSSNDSKTLKDAIDISLKNEHKLADLSIQLMRPSQYRLYAPFITRSQNKPRAISHGVVGISTKELIAQRVIRLRKVWFSGSLCECLSQNTNSGNKSCHHASQRNKSNR